MTEPNDKWGSRKKHLLDAAHRAQEKELARRQAVGKPPDAPSDEYDAAQGRIPTEAELPTEPDEAA